MSNKPIIYVAHPYRADTEEGVQQNIHDALKHAYRIWHWGGIALSPCNNSGGMHLFDPERPLEDEVFLSGDIQLLDKCDAIYLAGQWCLSAGCIAERNYAHQRDIRVLKTLFQVGRFIAEWNAGKEGGE